MAIIEVKGLKKNYGELEVLKSIDLEIEEGQVVCIIGPSGSGKSTFLRCINRLEEPTSGEIKINNTNTAIAFHFFFFFKLANKSANE